MKIRISLPDNRDFAGQLEILDTNGTIAFGPVPAAGRAHDLPATAHGNPSRNRLKPYGDTPLGSYAVRGVVDRTEVASEMGVVLLEPISGEAALADAHGRFRFVIQGETGVGLQATVGGVRLYDHNQKALLAFLRAVSEHLSCDVIETLEQGERVRLDRTPNDRDPPALPGARTSARAPLGLQATELVAHAHARTNGFMQRLFVVPELSGAGASTAYGSSGSGASGSDTPTPTGGSGDSDGSPLPTSGTDVAPLPGADLNPPFDTTSATLTETGSNQLLSSAPSTGSTDSYSPVQNGWIVAMPPTDSFTDTSARDPNASFTGLDANTYSGVQPDTANPNAYTGTQPPDPYSGVSGAPPPGQGQILTDDSLQLTYVYTPERDTLDNPDAAIQEMVTRFAQYDADLAAAQAAASSQQPSSPDPSQGSTQTPADPNNPWTTASTVGASSSQFPTAGAPPSPIPDPPRIESTGAWSRANPSPAAQSAIQEGVNMGFLDPALMGTNVATATGQTDASISRLIRGQTGETMAYDARLAQGEIGILAPKGASLRGLDYATASQLPNGDYQINVGDTASRFTQNPFKTSPGTAQPAWLQTIADTFGPNGGFSLPDHPAVEQGVRDAFTAGRISPVQIDTVDFSPQGQGAMTSNGSPVAYSEPASPGGVASSGGLGRAALGGAGVGAGVSTLINAGQILMNPDAHPDAARELSTTAFLGGTSGALGASIESVAAPTVGRTLGGGLGGGPAAAVFTLGQMALSDQQYDAIDYEAKGTRALVSGTLGGALSAGVVGAIWGSEVPLLGNAVGFVVGFGGYMLADWLFGDAVEDAVRGESHELGDFEPAQPDPSGFIST